MNKVVQFPTPSIPTASGEAFCIRCDHRWVATVELGTEYLECPECKTLKGVFKYPYAPETAWECNCGNQLFYITQDGHLCPNCGNNFNPEM